MSNAPATLAGANVEGEMDYTNEAVLEGLRRAQYRQVPWPRRPRVFEFLREQGLIGTARQPSPLVPGYHAPVDIAVLSAQGKTELGRLERRARLPAWSVERELRYACDAAASLLARAEPQP
ncbi:MULTISPECIES: hypothetical protein [Mycetohabitans]|uniref:hypothetical protein n=2 Tax=Burkholderiaceae TaxID=119060 RepID=UPI00351D17FB